MTGGAGAADASFGDGLAAAARAIIADGRHALTDPELTGPEAVHEVRKALKRWRALLRLLARPLGEQADQLRTEARELMRAVAGRCADAAGGFATLYMDITDTWFEGRGPELARR